MAGKEGNLITRLLDRLDASVPATRENILAYGTELEMRQLRQRRQYGNDNFPKNYIRGYFQKLNEDGFFCKKDSNGESTLTQSEDGNEVLIVTDKGVELSVKGIVGGNLFLIIDGQELAVPNSDPRYLKPMIAREMLRVETKMQNLKEVSAYEGTGMEYGKVVFAVLNEFRRRGEEGRRDDILGSDIVFPGTILLNEEDGFMVLKASDCVVGKSGRNYGHRIFLNINGPISLESNFSDGSKKIRSPKRAKREIGRLIDRYQDANWKVL